MSQQVLDYAGKTEPGRLTVDELPDGGVTITVPTRRRFGRWLAAVGEADLSALVLVFLLAPLMWIVFRLFRTSKPRAVIRLTRAELIISETSDDSLGHIVTSRSWPRQELGDVRKNQYQNSLYLRVPGKDNLDLLADLSGSEIEAIAGALATARERLERSAT